MSVGAIPLGLLAVVWLSAPAGAQPATDRPARPQVVLSGDLVVPRGVSVGEVVVVRGSVTVEGVVRGDVVVLDGTIRVLGQAAGAVVALDGPVFVGPEAQVRGDVFSSEGVSVRPGASVDGEIRENVRFTLRPFLSAIGRLIGWLAVSVSTLMLGLLLVFLAPRGADSIATASRSAPWASIGWGVFWLVALPVGSALLLVSLLGLPLAIALLLGLALFLFVGYAWTVWAVGRMVLGPPRNRALALLVGWAILRVVALVPLVDGVTWSLGAAFGLGAMTVSSWRARRTPGRHREGRGLVAAKPEEPARGWD